ncbi:MAG: DUF3363 domain-containing protein [Acetobacter aceti]|uniref:DUF3363 domain-containing protein n=1 Tax=Acetobacter aceti TaxID=435 RepID=UPI00215037C6|nr:DUF3363 domain-containing protein [Acetobacter aceti]
MSAAPPPLFLSSARTEWRSCARWPNRCRTGRGNELFSSRTGKRDVEFVLVPWKPVIENRIGQEIAGVMRAGTMDWQLGRQRGLGL